MKIFVLMVRSKTIRLVLVVLIGSVLLAVWLIL